MDLILEKNNVVLWLNKSTETPGSLCVHVCVFVFVPVVQH